MSLTNVIRAVAVATLAAAALFNPIGASAAPSASPMIVSPYESLSFSAKQAGNPQIAPVKGQPEREASSIVMKMGPGSFWYQPAGLAHGDACESDECVCFITFDGPRDFEAAASAK